MSYRPASNMTSQPISIGYPASGSAANFLSLIVGNTTNKILRSISTVAILSACRLAFIKLGEIIAGYPPPSYIPFTDKINLTLPILIPYC